MMLKKTARLKTGKSMADDVVMQALKHNLRMKVHVQKILRKVEIPCNQFREFPMEKRPPDESYENPRDDYTVFPINNPYKPGRYQWTPFFKF